MKLAKLIVLVFVVVFSPRTVAATFSTVTYPEPDYENRTVIILPEEENATVTFQCLAFQDGGLRFTQWFIQPNGASEMELEGILDFPQFVRSGSLFQNLTIVNATSDLDRAQVWCGPGVGQAEPRFLLGFEGKSTNFLNSCIYINLHSVRESGMHNYTFNQVAN